MIKLWGLVGTEQLLAAAGRTQGCECKYCFRIQPFRISTIFTEEYVYEGIRCPAYQTDQTEGRSGFHFEQGEI